MKPATSRHRVDSTAKALASEATSLGVGVVHLGGAIDAALFLGTVVRLVDWKAPAGGRLTDSQAKLLARGCPLLFVTTVDQLQVIVQGMKRDAHRTT
jgi:hypothetical protein